SLGGKQFGRRRGFLSAIAVGQYFSARRSGSPIRPAPPMNIALPILLVEDNPMDVDLTRRAFSQHKLINPLEVARDGQEALELIAGWREGELVPSVVLL